MAHMTNMTLMTFISHNAFTTFVFAIKNICVAFVINM